MRCLSDTLPGRFIMSSWLCPVTSTPPARLKFGLHSLHSSRQTPVARRAWHHMIMLACAHATINSGKHVHFMQRWQDAGPYTASDSLPLSINRSLPRKIGLRIKGAGTSSRMQVNNDSAARGGCRRQHGCLPACVPQQTAHRTAQGGTCHSTCTHRSILGWHNDSMLCCQRFQWPDSRRGSFAVQLCAAATQCTPLT